MKHLHLSWLILALVLLAVLGLLAGCGGATTTTTAAAVTPQSSAVTTEAVTTTLPVTTTSQAVTTTQAAMTTTTTGLDFQRIAGVPYLIREDNGLTPADLLTAKVDIYAPTEEGPWPVVVDIVGGDWASTIAQRGAVVYLPQWERSEGIHGHTSEELRTILEGQLGDVAAAIRFARATAEQYGGDPDYLTLFGHSAGANTAVVVALTGASPSEGALAGAGSVVPESLVLFDPDYLLASPEWEGMLASYPDIEELMALTRPWQHLGQRVDFPIVLLDSGASSLGRPLGDPWAEDSWFALRDPSGDFRRALDELGALSGTTYLNRSAAPLLVERLRADGDTVTYFPLTDSTHSYLGREGLENLLQACVPNASTQ